MFLFQTIQITIAKVDIVVRCLLNEVVVITSCTCALNGSFQQTSDTVKLFEL